MTMFYEIIIME